jgi:hypothetical protein
VSFAAIAEARAVKKIVSFLRARRSHAFYLEAANSARWRNPLEVVRHIADRIEDGEWKDIKLPKPTPKKKAKS